MTAGLFATARHDPRRAAGRESRQRQGRFGPQRRGQVLDEAGAELLVHRGQAAFEVRLRPGDLRGELLEQLQGLAGRNVAGERGHRPVDTPPRPRSRRQPATTPFPFVRPGTRT